MPPRRDAAGADPGAAGADERQLVKIARGLSPRARWGVARQCDAPGERGRAAAPAARGRDRDRQRTSGLLAGGLRPALPRAGAADRAHAAARRSARCTGTEASYVRSSRERYSAASEVFTARSQRPGDKACRNRLISFGFSRGHDCCCIFARRPPRRGELFSSVEGSAMKLRGLWLVGCCCWPQPYPGRKRTCWSRTTTPPAPARISTSRPSPSRT